jgi:hypothetical protein
LGPSTLPPGPGELRAARLPGDYQVQEWYGVAAIADQVKTADHWPGVYSFVVRPGDAPDLVIVRLLEQVPDRDTRLPSVKVSEISLFLPVTVQEITVRLRTMLRDNALHELDEALHFQGNRVFDPHAGEVAHGSGVYSVQRRKPRGT